MDPWFVMSVQEVGWMFSQSGLCGKKKIFPAVLGIKLRSHNCPDRSLADHTHYTG